MGFFLCLTNNWYGGFVTTFITAIPNAERIAIRDPYLVLRRSPRLCLLFSFKVVEIFCHGLFC